MKIIKVLKNFIKMYYVREMVFVSPFRKTFIKFCVYTGIFVSAILVCSLTNYLVNYNYYPILRLQRYQTDLKYILIWNPPRHRLGYKYNQNIPTGQKIFIKQKCIHYNCFITYDQNLLKDDHRNFNAVIFKVNHIVNYMPTDIINITRSPDQMYIFHSLESSEFYPVCNQIFDNFFNLTWTYKLNSDIPHPLLNIYDEHNKIIGPKRFVNWTRSMKHNNKYRNKIHFKSKAVAWVISKCKLKVKHKEFIDDLKNELKGYNYSMDLLGPCGDEKCPGRSSVGCHNHVEKHYYFQLIIDESFAEDYVTENMVRVMNTISIPIVLGGSNYKSFFPPGSYINAQSFDLKKLGAIIDYLIKKPTTYAYFFDWKNYYYYMARKRSNVCGLCAKLNEDNTKRTYGKFRTWWNPDYKEHCQRLI